MSKFFLMIIFFFMVRYPEFAIAMEEDNSCSPFSYETFSNVGKYMREVGLRNLDDYGDSEIMSALIARNFNMTQGQIEIIRCRLDDYDDPKIQNIILKNNYNMTQDQIDIIKNATKVGIVYYDVDDNFVMVDCQDDKIINYHSKIQRCKVRKMSGRAIAIPYVVKKMPALSEDDQDEDDGTL